jgi:hypothetical protein
VSVILGYELHARNQLFCALFLDVTFFSKLPAELRTNFVDFLAEILETSSTSELLDIDYLCKNLMFRFIGFYLMLTQKTTLGSGFYRILKMLALTRSTRFLETLKYLLQMTGIWTLQMPFSLMSDTFETLTLEYAKNQPAQLQFCSLIPESHRGVRILEDYQRLAFALLAPRPIAVRMPDRILELCTLDAFVTGNMIMIT